MNVFQHRPLESLTNNHSFKYLMKGLSFGLATAHGLALLAVPINPAIAANDSRDDFRRCASALANRLNLPQEEAVLACSRALNPEDMSECVTDVSRRGYEPADALNACRQVRQPREMASCVGSIGRNLKDSAAPEVLDNCRRSLLPKRYADCVVGVSRGASGLGPSMAMASCNDAQYFPREVDPTFIPYSTEQPSILLPETMQQTPQAPEVITPTPAPDPVTPTPAPQQPVRGLY